MTTKLYESVYTPAAKVDRLNHVIRDVKVLGRFSKNGREYSDKALEDTRKLSEGKAVNINHPVRRDIHVERGLLEGWGFLQNSRIASDGVYADLHYLDSHEATPVLVERIERFPDKLGLSIAGDGIQTRKNGKKFVESVDFMNSVDLVGVPATTNGLFESFDPPQRMTWVELLETLDIERFPGRDILLEEDAAMMPADASMGMDVGSGDQDEQVRSAISTLVDAIINDDSMGDAEKLNQIKLILKARSKLSTEPDANDDPDAPPAGAAIAGKPGSKPMMESLSMTEAEIKALQDEKAALQHKLNQLEGKDKARKLLESKDRNPLDIRVNAVAALLEDAEQVALIESWPVDAKVIDASNLRTNDASDLRGAKPQRREPLVESVAPGGAAEKYTVNGEGQFAAACR